jgi:hypothetical protein
MLTMDTHHNIPINNPPPFPSAWWNKGKCMISKPTCTWGVNDERSNSLTAALDYYKYMKIPLALFPEWIKKQYNLGKHARNGFIFLEI